MAICNISFGDSIGLFYGDADMGADVVAAYQLVDAGLVECVADSLVDT